MKALDSTKDVISRQYSPITQEQIVNTVKKRILNIANSYIGSADNYLTRANMTHEIHYTLELLFATGQIQKYHAEFVTPEKMKEKFTCDYEPLTRECNSYSEYCLKHAIIDPSKQCLSKDEFEIQHKFRKDRSFIDVDLTAAGSDIKMTLYVGDHNSLEA